MTERSEPVAAITHAGTSVEVSVVVATQNRQGSLARLLASLDRQTLPRSRFEVVVVDDGSTDRTSEVLVAYQGVATGPCRVLRLAEGRGPATARNAGVAVADGSIIAFTDDDCVPEAGWLEAGIAALGVDLGLVMGRTRADERAAGYGERFARTMEVCGEDGRYPTCNVFYRREALRRAGGFDESFRFACGEDTDLAWRVKQLGYASGFADRAVVVHDVRPPSFAQYLRERRRFADQILVVKRHPHLRSLFYRRYFYQRSHVHAILTLVILIVAIGGHPLAALLLPIVWLDRFRHSRMREPWPRRAWVAAQMLAGDVWELFVFGYGSLRYRTVLL